MKKSKQFDSLWDALEQDLLRAQNLGMRSELLTHIREVINERAQTQVKMAELLNITQPRVCALMQGRVEQFRLDSLLDIAHRLGLIVSLKVER